MRWLPTVMVRILLVPAACGDDPHAVQPEPLAETGASDPAEQGPAPPADLSWDADGDRLLDREEYSTQRGRVFALWDVDGDTRITDEEFAAGWTAAGWAGAEAAYAAFNDNADGHLDDHELFTPDEWAEWDRDGDGVLDRSEWRYGPSR